MRISDWSSDVCSSDLAWDLLVIAGDPAKPEVGARYHQATSANGWFGSPDNCTVDSAGRLWISTDQGSAWSKSGTADGLWGLETEGDLRDRKSTRLNSSH